MTSWELVYVLQCLMPDIKNPASGNQQGVNVCFLNCTGLRYGGKLEVVGFKLCDAV